MKDFPLPAISTGATYMKFDESDPDAMMTKDLIIERYVGLEMPIVCFKRDGYTLMAVPPTIRRVFPDAEPITDQEASLLRVPAEGL